jgi:hypothetical protein
MIKRSLTSRFPILYILSKWKETGLRNALINIQGYRAIKNNNLIYNEYYLEKYPYVRSSGMDPIIHYIYYGYMEGCKPNLEFDVDYYIGTYDDVKSSDINPLVHYSLYGMKEHRKTRVDPKTLEITKLKGIIKVLEGKIKTLKKEKEKLCTVPNFEGFRKSLKGKKGFEKFLFLVNDSNNEIRQHFDQYYVNKFNSSQFIENFKCKKEFCKNRNIKYYFFLVPDKSYICRDLLPFDIKIVKRNYDLINHLVPDFADYLDQTSYWKTDTHINFLGGKELTFHILNHVDNKFKRKTFDKLIDEQMITFYEKKEKITFFNTNFLACDLVYKDSFSYSEEERLKYCDEKTRTLEHKYIKDIKESLPEKFKFFDKRETDYYFNENSLTDLKVLVLRDSSTNYIKSIIPIYFKEVLLYWDHWIFNKELVEWYKPDIILEIRTERLLENMESEIIKRKNIA